jgi:hypothetical protein
MGRHPEPPGRRPGCDRPLPHLPEVQSWAVLKQSWAVLSSLQAVLRQLQAAAHPQWRLACLAVAAVHLICLFRCLLCCLLPWLPTGPALSSTAPVCPRTRMAPTQPPFTSAQDGVAPQTRETYQWTSRGGGCARLPLLCSCLRIAEHGRPLACARCAGWLAPAFCARSATSQTLCPNVRPAQHIRQHLPAPAGLRAGASILT